MLKCHVNKKKGHSWVKAKGTAQEVMVETAMLIQQTYQDIHQQNPEAAHGYKNNLLGTLLDPKSPVWKEESHESKRT